jgi:hypothetical protein
MKKGLSRIPLRLIMPTKSAHQIVFYASGP